MKVYDKEKQRKNRKLNWELKYIHVISTQNFELAVEREKKP